MEQKPTLANVPKKTDHDLPCVPVLKTTPAAYPLSPLKEGLLFHALNSPDSSAHFEQMIGMFHAKMDDQAYEQAWQMAIKRYDVLKHPLDGKDWLGLSKLDILFEVK